jgi:hypothetical protein
LVMELHISKGIEYIFLLCQPTALESSTYRSCSTPGL